MADRPHVEILKQKSYLKLRRNDPMRFFGKKLVIILIMLATGISIFSYRVNSTLESSASPNLSLLGTLKQLVLSTGDHLKGEKDDRVNILLMGVGGEGHDGPQLSDTIVFASYKPSNKSVGLMSLPRDLSVPIPGYGFRKINHANAYGEMESVGKGPQLATTVVESILDEEIHYYLRVDFHGFEQAIDAIGGLDLFVDQAFEDPSYPINGMEIAECGSPSPSDPLVSSDQTSPNTSSSDSDEPISPSSPLLLPISPPPIDYSCRFESLSFQQGWQHMNGKTALKYVRSRHGNNGEGSDFARSKRQQKILLAFKDKVLSASTLLNPTRISGMLDALQKNIATNMNVWELMRLGGDLKNLSNQSITHHVIDASASSPLYATVVNGAYVLLPKNDDWKALQLTADNIFTPDEELAKQFTPIGEKPKFVRIEIQNATTISGLALRASSILKNEGYEIAKIGNADSKKYPHTVIYDLTDGKKSAELKDLKTLLQADVTMSATGWMLSGEVIPKALTFSKQDYEGLVTESSIDFLVILGESASSLARE